jgi:hypothetical protein
MMGFFDDEGFFGGGIDELFNRLAGQGMVEYNYVDSDGKKRSLSKGKRSLFGKVFLEKVKTSKRIYFIFDLSDKNNIFCKVEKEFSEDVYGKRIKTGNKVLEVYSKDALLFNFPLEDLDGKDMETNFNNGLLEVSFKK